MREVRQARLSIDSVPGARLGCGCLWAQGWSIKRTAASKPSFSFSDLSQETPKCTLINGVEG